MKKLVPSVRTPRHLLARILDTPDLADVVRSLEPGVLHQLVRRCGLEDCGEIVALATTEQLVRVFDDDLWRSEKAGAEERFDADRFALWLEVLAEAGAELAADKLAAMDFEFVTAAVSRYLLVVDSLSVMTLATEAEQEGDETSDELQARRDAAKGLLDDAVSLEISGYTLVARRGEHWDALASILASLEERHHALLGRVLKRCAHLASEWIADNGGLYDVLSSEAQLLDDVAGDREERRDEQGYVALPQAAAFLKLAREPRSAGAAGPDPITASYFRELAHRDDAAPKAALEPKVAAFLASLREGGVLEAPPQALLPAAPEDGGQDPLSRIRAHLLLVQEHSQELYARRVEELAYLANVLVAGCAFGSRRFRSVEAADAVLAVCNLGLENLGSAAAPAQELVSVFQRGFSILHHDVSMYVAERLVKLLAGLRCSDRWMQAQLRDLGARMKAQLERGTPWLERDRLDSIAALDPPSWATLTALLSECPVLPKRVAEDRLRISPETEFFSENRQIAWVRDFLESLPERLVER